MPGGNRDAQLLGNLATIGRGQSPTNVTHYNIAPTFDVQVNVQGSDLASVSKQIEKIVEDVKPKLPPGSGVDENGKETTDPAKVKESRETGVALPGLHSGLFAPVPEPTLRTGVKAMTSAVLELMKK